MKNWTLKACGKGKEKGDERRSRCIVVEWC